MTLVSISKTITLSNVHVKAIKRLNKIYNRILKSIFFINFTFYEDYFYINKESENIRIMLECTLYTLVYEWKPYHKISFLFKCNLAWWNNKLVKFRCSLYFWIKIGFFVKWNSVLSLTLLPNTCSYLQSIIILLCYIIIKFGALLAWCCHCINEGPFTVG